MCPVRTFGPAQHDSNVRPTPLEAVKMSRNNKLDNGFNLLTFGVQYAPRTLVSGGMPWMSGGIGRRSSGRTWDLSGKPTKQHPKVVFLFVDGPGRNRLGQRSSYPWATLLSNNVFIVSHSLSIMLNRTEFLMRPLGIIRSLRIMPSCLAPILKIAFLES